MWWVIGYAAGALVTLVLLLLGSVTIDDEPMTEMDYWLATLLWPGMWILWLGERGMLIHEKWRTKGKT